MTPGHPDRIWLQANAPGVYLGACAEDLTTVGDELTPAERTWRILNGGTDRPAFGGNMTPAELDALLTFLKSRISRR